MRKKNKIKKRLKTKRGRKCKNANPKRICNIRGDNVMRLITPKINVEVKYKKISANNIVAKPEILRKTENGIKVESKRISDQGQIIQKLTWANFADGEQIEKKDIHYFQILEDGKEIPVSPFNRTKEITIVKEINVANIEDFLIDSYYELYHVKDDEINELYREAERYFKEDIAGIALFSWGNGFQQYYALIKPIIRKNKFVWIMQLTQTKLEYHYLMAIPKEKLTTTPKPPTIATLPPIEMIT